MKNFFVCVIGIICVTGCGYLSYLKDPFVDIPQFVQVDERLYRGGAPNEAGLRLIKEKGIKTVISLQGVSDTQQAEKELVESLGMKFVSLPMSVDERPGDEAILTFLETVLTPDDAPVFVHCASGRDRTGAVVAVYRVTFNEWGPKEAYKEAKKYGFWPYKGEYALKNFIHQLKDKKIYFEKVETLKAQHAIH